MKDQMEDLAAAWAGWMRHRNIVQDRVIDLIRKTDARFATDEARRQVELQRLRESFYKVALADKLADSVKCKSLSPEQILERAEVVRAKQVHDMFARCRSSSMRTAEEERWYGSARVRWCKLLKKARVAAADPRGGDTSAYRWSTR